ncbi:hypothetical protein DSM106972_029140 [Dulcicalothrix desertica PCC 7102]|uniref:Uncharacterized protein n=1 Tax=Dulcicalothrix desertica PCC 7102 TaxID=232991 RepID=A0A3S1CQR4_9CYAN|nr:hypothetical protein [Dulcicalothrix desertica]RUT06657.1 hypothetical protein DSM106972_029140 [Dulcicalothrix desertica PCC 7102]TWH50231.1 hypothetical protein CAL7102_04523 [Dulcicalothrix desertica PCC 7102]
MSYELKPLLQVNLHPQLTEMTTIGCQKLCFPSTQHDSLLTQHSELLNKVKNVSQK